MIAQKLRMNEANRGQRKNTARFQILFLRCSSEIARPRVGIENNAAGKRLALGEISHHDSVANERQHRRRQSQLGQRGFSRRDRVAVAQKNSRRKISRSVLDANLGAVSQVRRRRPEAIGTPNDYIDRIICVSDFSGRDDITAPDPVIMIVARDRHVRQIQSTARRRDRFPPPHDDDFAASESVPTLSPVAPSPSRLDEIFPRLPSP